MKSQGEIEAAICEGMTRFEQEYMGRGPKDIHAHLIGDLLVVRLQGVLTAAEQQLVKTLPAEKGRNLLKEVRTQLIETARLVLEALIQEVTGPVLERTNLLLNRSGRLFSGPCAPPARPAGRVACGGCRQPSMFGRSAWQPPQPGAHVAGRPLRPSRACRPSGAGSRAAGAPRSSSSGSPR